MTLNEHALRLTVFALAATLIGCGNSGSPNAVVGGGAMTPVSPLPTTNFAAAKGCFAMKVNGAYVVQDASGFIASASSADTAEHFYMQPAGLGRFVFYAKNKKLLTGSGTTVTATATPADGSDIHLAGSNPNYTATSLNLPISANSAGRLVLGGTAAVFALEPAPVNDCAGYPEMPVGIDAPTFKSQGINQPVIGFADVHTHMGMSSEMSDGSGMVGPSAAGALYGQPINRFGVIEALNNCVAIHGPDGTLSSENIVLDQDPTQTHDTVGWPTFVGWPQRDSFLHQQMYYRWIERAYKAGLRVMTNHGTNIEALCNITKATFGGDRNAECVDMEVGIQQVQYLFDIQDYVDAQSGGPGLGWYRIVKSPEEARAVIAEGKLAVIPGLEFPNIFHCRVQFLPDGSETSDCTKAEIDSQIQRSWDEGVRQIFPYHDVDSSLGGTGIFSAILNQVGATDTHAFWKTYPCEDGGEGDKYFYTAGAVLQNAPMPATPISGAGPLPIYGPGRQCNARTVTDLGKYAMDQMMKKGFLIDIDHAEIRSKQYMLDQGARTTPAYPMISGHGGQGGITNAQAEQILRQGGAVYPILPNGKGFADFIKKLKPVWVSSGSKKPFAAGYGADANGFHTLPNSRGAAAIPVVYPFTLFQGAGWGPQYAAAGIAPLKVDMLKVPGGKSWNMNEQGMSHYGLVPDIVEEIKIEGGEEATTALYNSAEDFLQLWEQTLKASASAQQLPAP